MIGSAVGSAGLEYHARGNERGTIWLFFEGCFTRIFDLVVVIKYIDFIRIDMPRTGACHLWIERGTRKRVVEVSQFRIKEIGVGAGVEGGLQVGIAAALYGGDRRFLCVRIEVAEEQ